MEYYSAIKRNEFELAIVRWMKLESVIQSEVSQKEKNKYCILMHIYGIQKSGIDEPISRKRIGTDTETCGLVGLREQDKWRKQQGHRYTTTSKTESW